MLNQKQENFQENASKKQDEIDFFFTKKKMSKSKGKNRKNKQIEGGRTFFFRPFFQPKQEKIVFFWGLPKKQDQIQKE